MATRRAEVRADNNLPEDYPVEVTASSRLPTHGYGVPPLDGVPEIHQTMMSAFDPLRTFGLL